MKTVFNIKLKFKTMKKVKLFLMAIIMVAGYALNAQVAINTDGTDPDASAGLDVKFTDKGMLIPRMAQSEMAAIPNPANGLQAFNTDDGKIYVYVLADNQWKEVQYGSGVINLPASYTIGTGGSCANTTVNGTYYEEIALYGYNTVTLDATVSTKGTWSITTNTVNGYGFSGSGTFASTGTVQVTLNGTGTPTAAQTDNFNATANGSGGTCTFDVTVLTEPLVPTVYNPTTGETWMDCNLGASQVATYSNDAAAYGDLYQWGRAADGHESRTSDSTSTNATTAVPNAGNSWDGLFITEGNSPYDWLTPQDNTLWQGVSGTNNPCPSGFRLPTGAEWDAERNSWSSNDAAGAYGSPLKLVVGGYRNHANGLLDLFGSAGLYWSSSISGIYARNLYFYSSDAGMGSYERAFGFSVRCIRD